MEKLTLNFSKAAAAVAEPAVAPVTVKPVVNQPTPRKDGKPGNGAVSVRSDEVAVAAAAASVDEFDKMDQAALLKAAKELRAKLSGKPEPKPEEKTPPAEPVATEPTPEQKAAAEKYHQAIETQFTTTFGTPEKVQDAIKWANASLDETSVNAFNAALDSGNPVMMATAIKILNDEYVKVNGKDAASITPGLPVVPNGGDNGQFPAFRDSSEMVAAMSDPRYKVSQAYRDDVEKRLMKSKF